MTVQIRTLRRAVELLGSEEALARVIGAPRQALSQWLKGVLEIPPIYFVRAVDVVLAVDNDPSTDQLSAAKHEDAPAVPRDDALSP